MTTFRSFFFRALGAACLLGLLSSVFPPSAPAGPFDPVFARSHLETIRSGAHAYTVFTGGTVGTENTATRLHAGFSTAFPANRKLVIANTGSAAVKNPRLCVNGKRRWWSLSDMAAEATQGAKTDREKALFIWDFVRENRHQDAAAFCGPELHDPVKYLNIYGGGLCDDTAWALYSLYATAGLDAKSHPNGPLVRYLRGHVMAEAPGESGLLFLDAARSAYYRDVENLRPVSGREAAEDPWLIQREHHFGPLFQGFETGAGVCGLFGPDDFFSADRVRGHRMDFSLRPGEEIAFLWEPGKKPASDSGVALVRFGNARWTFSPELSRNRVEKDAADVAGLRFFRLDGAPGVLPGRTGKEELVYEVKTPWVLAGARVFANALLGGFLSKVTVSASTDGRDWAPVFEKSGPGEEKILVDLEEVLSPKNGPARYGFFVKIRLKGDAVLSGLRLSADLMAAPLSFPGLFLGNNLVSYSDETPGPHEVLIRHFWNESSAITPPAPPMEPLSPKNGEAVRRTGVAFSWPETPDAKAWRFFLSDREDLRIPWGGNFDLILGEPRLENPWPGLFSPGKTYYWRVRPRDENGVWGAWSPVFRFAWQGPAPPLSLAAERKAGGWKLVWKENPRGTKPVAYEIYRGTGPVPGREGQKNLLEETASTFFELGGAAKGRFRVLAVDGAGVRSGPSSPMDIP